MYITKENSALREKALVKLHKLMKLCILGMNSFYQCVKKKYSQIKSNSLLRSTCIYSLLQLKRSKIGDKMKEKMR